MRAVGIILMIIGALIGGTGGYGMTTYLGTGDWVVGPKAVVNPNGEHVVVTQYGALTYTSDIRLTATSPTEVFVGTANPIDIDDLTGGVAHSTITSLSLQRIGVTSTSAEAKDLPAQPGTLDVWLDKVSGTAPVLAVHPGAAMPAQAILVAKSGDPVTVRVDYEVAGIRNDAYAVIGAGAALALLGLVLLVVGIFRARRKKRRQSGPPVPPASPPPVQHTAPPWLQAPVQPTPPPTAPPSPTPWGQGPVARWVAGLVAFTLLATTAGCTMPTVPKMPKAGDVLSRAEITKVPLSAYDEGAVGVSIANRAEQEGIDGFTPKYSTEGWAGLYTDVPLMKNVFASTFAKASASTTAAPSCSASIYTVYSSIAKAYPMTATALVKWGCQTGQPDWYFTVLTHEHSYSPWYISAESYLQADGPKSGSVPPTAAEDKAGSVAVTDVLHYLNTGTAGTVKPTIDLATFYARATTPSEGSIDTLTATILNNADKQGAYRTARTETGTLVTASYVVTVTSTARPGYELWWDAPLDKILNQPGHRPVLVRKYGLVATMLVEGDTVTMIGFEGDPIL